MKFNLTITDLTPDKLSAIQRALDSVVQATAPAPAEPEPAPAMQAAMTQAIPMPAPVAPPAPLVPAPVAHTAPEPVTVPAPAPAASSEVDDTGVPYDPELHSSPPSKTTKGTWRKKRKPKGSVEPVLETPPQTPVHVTTAPEPVSAAPSGDIDFAGFMTRITDKMSQTGPDGLPLITSEILGTMTAEIAQAFQTPLSVITDISTNPQMINYAVQLLQRDGRW